MTDNVQIINNFYVASKRNIKYIKNIKGILNTYKKDIVENKYVLFIADNELIIKLFILFLYYYADKIKKITNVKHHCAIDFEFYKGTIALMQINFGKYVWIIDPKDYDRDKIEVINNKLLLNDNVYKVLHGSESLDLPYIFTELFNNDKNKIMKLMGKFIDTRFLCEYVRSSLEEEGRCSIYNAMLYFKTITQDKFDELEKNNKLMGPIQNIKWDIKNLSSFHIRYAFYDVLYLIDFLKDIYKKITNETPNLIRTYYYINQVLRFVILERRNVMNIMDDLKMVVNKINNYIVKDKNITLLNLYNELMEKCILVDNNKGYVDMNFIESNNYVKGVFSFLLKYIAYYVISKKYIVYKNKNEIMNEAVSIKDLYEKLEENKMYKIINLLRLYESNILEKLK